MYKNGGNVLKRMEMRRSECNSIRKKVNIRKSSERKYVGMEESVYDG